MRIIVAGDFHIPERANKIPKKLISQKTDYFICTGDLTSENVLKKLNKFKNLIVVRGNCDYLNLPEYKEIEISNKRIGVVHSHQFGRGKISLIRNFAKIQKLDLLVFGHTHKPFIEENTPMLLNPGTATGVFSGGFEKVKRTFAIIEISNTIEMKIIEI